MTNKNSFSKNNKKTNNGPKKKIPSNAFVMKVLTILGVAMLCTGAVYLMNYFFVKKSDIKINMSMDKKVDYISINGKDELITTQKYISDLGYNMRYDINNFSVFKYKSQDIYKYNDEEKILVVVEKSSVPKNCKEVKNDTDYNSCEVSVDNYTNENYISYDNKTYKITIKGANVNSFESQIQSRIDYMLNSFEIASN